MHYALFCIQNLFFKLKYLFSIILFLKEFFGFKAASFEVLNTIKFSFKMEIFEIFQKIPENADEINKNI